MLVLKGSQALCPSIHHLPLHVHRPSIHPPTASLSLQYSRFCCNAKHTFLKTTVQCKVLQSNTELMGKTRLGAQHPKSVSKKKRDRDIIKMVAQSSTCKMAKKRTDTKINMVLYREDSLTLAFGNECQQVCSVSCCNVVTEGCLKRTGGKL